MITLTSLEQSLGEELAVQLPDLESLWQESADCDAFKTGMGLNRRAYFLDNCRFENTVAHTICGETPERIDYYFLEGKLVQISFELDSPTTDLASCVAAEFALEDEIRSVEQLGANKLITASAERLIFVKVSGAAGIIVEPTRLSIIEAKIVPDVHYLQTLFGASEK